LLNENTIDVDEYIPGRMSLRLTITFCLKQISQRQYLFVTLLNITLSPYFCWFHCAGLLFVCTGKVYLKTINAIRPTWAIQCCLLGTVQKRTKTTGLSKTG